MDLDVYGCVCTSYYAMFGDEVVCRLRKMDRWDGGEFYVFNVSRVRLVSHGLSGLIKLSDILPF